MNNTQVKAVRDLWADVTTKPVVITEAEIRAAEERSRKAWELTEMVDVPHLGKVTVAALRWAFEQVQDKANWKAPITAEVMGHRVLVTVAAIEFCQADAPSVSWVKDRVVTPTYDDLALRPFCPFFIMSKGYQAY